MSTTREFDPDRVKPLPGQPRKRFRRIPELAASIRRIGQSCPGKVTLLQGDKDFDAQLVDGERRLRACKLARVKFRAEIESSGTDAEIFRKSFGANFGRQDHDVMEIARAVQRMQDDGSTIEEIAEIAGMSSVWVSTHKSLLRLAPDVQDMLVPDDDDASKLTFSIALLLLPLEHKDQRRLAREIVSKDLGLAKARRMVLKFRGEIGLKMTRSGRHKMRSMGSIASAVEEMSTKLGIYEDMPGQEFAAMIASLDPRERVIMVERMEDLAMTLESMAESFKQVGLKKAV